MVKSHSDKKQIGIIGGSFDPIHLGHLVIAQDALELLGLDEILFIPAALPPHKQHLERVDFSHRMRMVELAIKQNSRFSASNIEALRGGVSYTIDTVLSLQEERPEVSWTLIVGSDTLVDLHTWYRIDDLLARCEVATFLRPGESDLEAIASKISVSDEHKISLVANLFQPHLMEISSTEIRERIAEGKNIRYFVPSAVHEYIENHSLYRK